MADVRAGLKKYLFEAEVLRLMGLNLLVKPIGLVTQMVIAGSFGAGYEYDAYALTVFLVTFFLAVIFFLAGFLVVVLFLVAFLAVFFFLADSLSTTNSTISIFQPSIFCSFLYWCSHIILSILIF